MTEPRSSRGPTPMPEWLERQFESAERTVASWSPGKREAAGIPDDPVKRTLQPGVLGTIDGVPWVLLPEGCGIPDMLRYTPTVNTLLLIDKETYIETDAQTANFLLTGNNTLVPGSFCEIDNCFKLNSTVKELGYRLPLTTETVKYLGCKFVNKKRPLVPGYYFAKPAGKSTKKPGEPVWTIVKITDSYEYSQGIAWWKGNQFTIDCFTEYTPVNLPSNEVQ